MVTGTSLVSFERLYKIMLEEVYGWLLAMVVQPPSLASKLRNRLILNPIAGGGVITMRELQSFLPTFSFLEACNWQLENSELCGPLV